MQLQISIPRELCEVSDATVMELYDEIEKEPKKAPKASSARRSTSAADDYL